MKNSSKKYTSERQAIIYELAEKEGIVIGKNDDFLKFVKKKKKEIDSLLDNIGEKNKSGRDYAKAVLEYRDKNKLYKEIPLSQLLQIFSIHQNEEGYKELGISPDDVLVLPKNKIINSEIVNSDRGVIRMKDLEEAQNDSTYGYTAELLSNAIDASIRDKSIGRFGQGFLQVIDKIKEPDSKVIVSTKYEGTQGYDIFLTKKNQDGNGQADFETYFSSTRNNKIAPGTSVKLEKNFSKKEQEKIHSYMFDKFKTNSRAHILFNGKLLNDLQGYKYINGEKLNLSNIPTVEVKLGDSEVEFIDHGVGMTSDTIVNTLLKPNATGNIRKNLTDEEVLESTPQQTKFFYKSKKQASQKTHISLNISGVSIEDFETETLGSIGDFTLEFPASSPLKDSRNEVEISREVSTAMKVSLEKIEEKSENIEEKLSLLEVIGAIYEKLKDRSSNIVDEEFVLSSVLKKGFHNIRENLEKQGIAVLPSNKELVDNLGYPEDTFYISEEFVNFDIKNIKDKKEIERVKPTTIKGSFIGEKYSFFETEFIQDSQYDYFTYRDYVFVNSDLFNGKSDSQKDDIIMGLNVGVNQNTSYQTQSETLDFGRILTSGEHFVKVNKKEKLDNDFLYKKNQLRKLDIGETVSDKDKEQRIDYEVSTILYDLDKLRKKYEGKIVSDNQGVNTRSLSQFVRSKVNKDDFSKNRQDYIGTLKLNLLFGSFFYDGMDYIPKGKSLSILSIITNFLDSKSETVTKPFSLFLSKVYTIYQNSSRMEKNLGGDFELYVKTLVKILNKDPKVGIEFIERVGEVYSGKEGYVIFSDYFHLEELNKQQDSDNKSEDLLGYYENSFLNSKYEDVVKSFLDIVSTDYWDFTEMKTQHGVVLSGGAWTYNYFPKIFQVLKSGGIDKTEIEELKNLIEECTNSDNRITNEKFSIITSYLNKNNLVKEFISSSSSILNDVELVNILKSYFEVEKDIVVQLKEKEKQKNQGGYYENSFLNPKYSDITDEFFTEISARFLGLDDAVTEYCNDLPMYDWPFEYFPEVFNLVKSGNISREHFEGLRDIIYEVTVIEKDENFPESEPILNYIKENGLERMFRLCLSTGGILDTIFTLKSYFETERYFIEQLQGKEKIEGNDYSENSFFNGEYTEVRKKYFEFCKFYGENGHFGGKGFEYFNELYGIEFPEIDHQSFRYLEIFKLFNLILNKKDVFKIKKTISEGVINNNLNLSEFIEYISFYDLEEVCLRVVPCGGLIQLGCLIKDYFKVEDSIINQLQENEKGKNIEEEEGTEEDLYLMNSFLDSDNSEIRDLYFKIMDSDIQKNPVIKEKSDFERIYNDEMRVFFTPYSSPNLIYREFFKAFNDELISIETAVKIEKIANGYLVMKEGAYSKDEEDRYFKEFSKILPEWESIFGIDDMSELLWQINFYFEEEEIIVTQYKYNKEAELWIERVKEKFESTDYSKFDSFNESFIKILLDDLDSPISHLGIDLDNKELLKLCNKFNISTETFDEAVYDRIGIEYYLSQFADMDQLKARYEGFEGDLRYTEAQDFFFKNIHNIGEALEDSDLLYRYCQDHNLHFEMFTHVISKYELCQLFLQIEEDAFWNNELKKQSKKVDIFTELSKTYPQDLITFVQFLKSGGDFLETKESKVGEIDGQVRIKLSDLIGISLSMQGEIKKGMQLQDLLSLQLEQKQAGITHEDKKQLIAGVNIAQDEGGMLFYREGTQNAVDAIKRYNKTHNREGKKLEESIEWETYSIGNNFVSSVNDGVGMDLETVITKLFTPYNTGKSDGESTGKFGKGFFTFSPASKQINIKTSPGDGVVLYISLTPQKLDGVINDFDINIESKNEDFQGTTIERIDEADGISGNLRAMIGSNLLKKYVGNVDSATINYNSTVLNPQGALEILNSSKNIVGNNDKGEEINFGDLLLLKNVDSISRFTKDGLFISEIKDDILADLPDWIIKEFNDSRLSIDIPSGIPLIGSRNSIQNRQQYISILKPYFYKQVIDFILTSYVSRDIKIPQLPDDYLGMRRYDYSHTTEVKRLAGLFNASDSVNFDLENINYLKDDKKMAEFLVLCEFDFDGKKSSLIQFKQELLEKEQLENAHRFSQRFQQSAFQGVELSKSIEEKNQSAKYELTLEEIEERTDLTSKQINAFERMILENKGIQFLINTHFGGNFDISYSVFPGGFIADSHSKGMYGMSLGVTSNMFRDYITNSESPDVFEDFLETITHEMAHNLEGGDWATHNDNFLKIQKNLLRDYNRNV